MKASGIIEVLEGRVLDLEVPPETGDIRIATRRRGGVTMTALGTCVLGYDAEHDCVYLGAVDNREMPIWPSGTRALRDQVGVVDGDGRVIAAVGERFQAGGGHVEGVADESLACGAANSFVM